MPGLVLGQPETDIEVIAVDDCSPDASGEIIDEYAARDQRVRSVRLSENVGLGPARNIGLDRAVGEYVWFLDGDDWLAPECLTEVAERLRATRPDVLLVDHVRTHWNDTATRSAMAEVFPESPGAGHLPAAGPAGGDAPAAHRVEPAGPAGVPGRPGAALRARLVRGRLVQLSRC